MSIRAETGGIRRPLVEENLSGRRSSNAICVAGATGHSRSSGGPTSKGNSK